MARDLSRSGWFSSRAITVVEAEPLKHVSLRRKFTHDGLDQAISGTGGSDIAHPHPFADFGYELISLGKVKGIGDFRDGRTILCRKETETKGTYLYLALYWANDPAQAVHEASASLTFAAVTPDNPMSLHFGLANDEGDYFNHLGYYMRIGPNDSFVDLVHSIEAELPQKLSIYNRTIFRDEEYVPFPKDFKAGETYTLRHDYTVAAYHRNPNFVSGGYTIKAGAKLRLLAGSVDLEKWPEKQIPEGGLVSCTAPIYTGTWPLRSGNIIRHKPCEEIGKHQTHISFVIPADEFRDGNKSSKPQITGP